MNGQLQKSFAYFVEHQAELVQHHLGKFVVIHDEAVCGAYDSALEASTQAQKKFGIGTFLVQRVQPGTDSFTQTYYSRAGAA